MLSKRVIALSSDKALSKRLASGLMAAGGSTEVRGAPAELPAGEIKADLVVIHVTSEAERAWIDEVGKRAVKQASLMAIVPKSSLETVVDVARGTRVNAVMVADQLDSSHLSAVATRLMYGDVFGLEKVVPWGVRVYSHLVGDYQEKSVTISGVSDYAASIGVRRKYREPIEQCLDEMLMNALYDAPVDAEGKQLFADVPTKTRISLRMEQKAVVQYACDGTRFWLSVRDSFGALDPNTVVEYLHKCLHAAQQIDRKAGGAGLGLYIIANASTQFFVNVYPGLATEVVVTFDLTAAKVQLKEFGLFHEKIDSSGRLVAGPSQLVRGTTGKMPVVQQPAAPASSKGVIAALGAAILLLLALVAIVAWPRFSTDPAGAVAIVTMPPGATVEVEGKSVGTTADGPLVVDDLKAGQAYKVTATLDGHRPAEGIVVAEKNGQARVTLNLTALAPTVVFETEPSGAVVSIDGRDLGTTPFSTTELPSTADSMAEVTFKKPGYQPLTRSVRLPEPGRQATIFMPLTVVGDFGTVDLASKPSGARIAHNGSLLPSPTPVENLLVEGGKTHTFTFSRPGFRPVTREVQAESGKEAPPIEVELTPGGSLSLDSNIPNLKVTVAKSRCKNEDLPASCALPNGKHRVSIQGNNPWLRDQFTVTVKGNDVTRELAYGVVEAASDDLMLKVKGMPRGRPRLALPEGNHEVTVTDPASGDSATRKVKVAPGRPTRITL